MAVPANDGLASATALTGAPINATGNNLGATAEVGEPAPLPNDAAGASVWWSWTAPATGWFELATTGSDFDTILAVYKSAAMTALVRVAADDDDPVLPGQVSTSRVRFEATAGVVYAIAVQGFQGATGNISLNLQSVGAPANLVTNVTYSATPANVTSANVNVTVQFTIASGNPLSTGLFELYTPKGALLTVSPFSDTDRISGTTTAGTYQLRFTVPRYTPPGTLPFAISLATTVSDPDYVFVVGGFGWQSLPAALGAGLPVTNTGSVDLAAPTLISAVPALATVDVTSADATFNTTLIIADNLSGFKAGTISLALPAGPNQVEIVATSDFLLNQRTSGSATNGTYKIPLTVPTNSVAGVATILLDLTDAVGNSVSVVSTATVSITKDAFASWAVDNLLVGPDALPTADADGDGLNNLLEFALNLDPQSNARPEFIPGTNAVTTTQSGNGMLPYQTLNHDSQPPVYKFRFLRRRGLNAGGVTYAPQFSSDLTSWDTPVGASLTITPLTAEWEWVEATDPAPSTMRRFARLQLTKS